RRRSSPSSSSVRSRRARCRRRAPWRRPRRCRRGPPASRASRGPGRRRRGPPRDRSRPPARRARVRRPPRSPRRRARTTPRAGRGARRRTPRARSGARPRRRAPDRRPRRQRRARSCGPSTGAVEVGQGGRMRCDNATRIVRREPPALPTLTMRTRLKGAFPAVLLCTIASLTASRIRAASPLPRSVPLTSSMELRELSASAPLSRVRLEKQTLTEATRKIGSALRAVADAKRPAAGPLVALPPSLSSDGRVRVYLRLKHVGAAELESLRQLGARIETSREALNVVQAAIEPKDVKRLAALSFVEALNPADVPVFRVGAATTEGDQAARADLARMLGFDGSGVTVGVISDGIDSLTVSQASGDLGEVTVPNDVRCRAGTGDEGTAILEIVHDIAPGAKLLFSGPGTSVEMIEAVECLTAAGADVIVDDVGFLGEPFFQDGPVATAVRAAVQAGVSYHSAAGNDGQDYLEQDYRASPSTSFHDF